MVAMPQQLVAIPEQLKAYYNDFQLSRPGVWNCSKVPFFRVLFQPC